MRSKGQDPYARQRRDTDEAFAFRQRMAQPDAKEKYKQRSSIAEFPNAECRNRGLQQFRVRGLQKVKAVALWYALAFNFLRMTHHADDSSSSSRPLLGATNCVCWWMA